MNQIYTIKNKIQHHIIYKVAEKFLSQEIIISRKAIKYLMICNLRAIYTIPQQHRIVSFSLTCYELQNFTHRRTTQDAFIGGFLRYFFQYFLSQLSNFPPNIKR